MTTFILLVIFHCVNMQQLSALLCHSDTTAYARDVETKLFETGLFPSSSINIVNCNLETPAISTLKMYSSVLVWSTNPFANPTMLGDNLADYVDAGFTVVVAYNSFYNGVGAVGIAGRLTNGNYLSLTQTDMSKGDKQSLVPIIPSHRLLTGVKYFEGSSYSPRSIVSLSSGATNVAQWSDGLPLIAVKGIVVCLNFYPVSTSVDVQGWNNLTNGAHLLANALLFRQDVVTTKTTVPTTTTANKSTSISYSTTSTTLLNKTTMVNDTSLSTALRSTTQQFTTIDATSTSSAFYTSSIESMDVFMPLSTIIAIIVGVLLLMIIVGLILIVALKCRKTSSNLKTEIANNDINHREILANVSSVDQQSIAVQSGNQSQLVTGEAQYGETTFVRQQQRQQEYEANYGQTSYSAIE